MQFSALFCAPLRGGYRPQAVVSVYAHWHPLREVAAANYPSPAIMKHVWWVADLVGRSCFIQRGKA
eukprot:13562457-Alexandrium_andersonii.AAC.1